MQVHHIEPDAEGGSGDYDNGIPVCLDCHAEIESHSNMGRSFTPGELKAHRDRWFQIVREQPEVLLRAAHAETQAGPLEALLAELEFDLAAISVVQHEPLPLMVSQFERAMSANALAALSETARRVVHGAYVHISRLNFFAQEVVMSRAGNANTDMLHGRTQRIVESLSWEALRESVSTSIPEAIRELQLALGRTPDQVDDGRDTERSGGSGERM